MNQRGGRAGGRAGHMGMQGMGGGRPRRRPQAGATARGARGFDARAFTRHVTRVDTTAGMPGDFRVMAYLSTPPPYALSYPAPASGSTRAAHPQLKLTASGVSSLRTALRMARRTERSI